MKKVFYLIVFSLFVFGCTKDDEYDEISNMMQARINGELVIFDEIHPDGPISFEYNKSCVKHIDHVHGGLYLGRDSIGHSITIYVPIYKGIVTYNANALYLRHNRKHLYSPHYDWAGYYQNYPGTDVRLEGEVTITSIANDRGEGTFYFTSVNCNGRAEQLGFQDKMVVTEGKFIIPTNFKSLCANN